MISSELRKVIIAKPLMTMFWFQLPVAQERRRKPLHSPLVGTRYVFWHAPISRGSSFKRIPSKNLLPPKVQWFLIPALLGIRGGETIVQLVKLLFVIEAAAARKEKQEAIVEVP
jgi:hypothetical protein